MRSLAYEGLVGKKKNSGHYRGRTVSERTLSRVDCTMRHINLDTKKIYIVGHWAFRPLIIGCVKILALLMIIIK